jgi:hypothetical protein
MNTKKIFILSLFLFSKIFLFAQQEQETLVVGQIFDKRDKIPLSSVNIYFKNTEIGTTSNDEGYFLLRSRGQERTLVFSSVGYKTREIRVDLGVPAFLNVELEEQNTLLEDIFVVPGVNPALEWMRKIRLQRRANDITNFPDYQAESIVQDLILMSRTEQRAMNRRLFEQLQKGTLSESDSSLLIPLYMAQSVHLLTNKGATELSRNLFSTSETADNLVVQILNGINPELNFYNNSVSVFGRSIISPLANIGNSFYNFYLADSILTENGKQYEIHFRSRNPKNLAFNGTFRFDSVSLALTFIEARLPRQANINFVQDLMIRQEFKALPHHRFAPKTSEMTMNLSYNIISGDNSNRNTELWIKQSSVINIPDSIDRLLDNFAASEYSIETLESRMQALDDTPLMRRVKWIADAALTGYAQVGKIDVGRLQYLARVTDVEGLRVNIPLRTNEHLWKNISIGGYVGYGFRNQEVKYSAFGQFRLPTEKRRIFEVRYTDDFRRIDYNYNNFIMRENVWNLGDDDITSTLFHFHSAPKISPRREWSFSLSNDWSKNIETTAYFRINELFNSEFLPLSVNGTGLSSFRQQSLTFATRFSFNQRKLEDHLQRIYITNNKPVIYSILEVGQYNINGKAEQYGKIAGAMKQRVRFDIGTWNYIAEAGWIFGRVPYPLLEIPAGSEHGGINLHRYNRMHYSEFGFDKYIRFNNEFIFNGILFNHIPLIKHLNFRELIALKMIVGDLSDRHREVLDFPNPSEFPNYLHPFQNPYIEGAIGITNILRIFTVQMNWRFTNNYEEISPRSVSAGLRIEF